MISRDKKNRLTKQQWIRDEIDKLTNLQLQEICYTFMYYLSKPEIREIIDQVRTTNKVKFTTYKD